MMRAQSAFLGWVGEFTSKIVSRLKLWHAIGGLLPVIGGLLCLERGTAEWLPPGLLQDTCITCVYI